MPAIFDHHLDDMTNAVMAAIANNTSSDPIHPDVVKAALASCWEDTAAITWTVDDVRSEHLGLSKDQARDVLVAMVHNHDASRGISWENMGSYVERVVPDYDEAYEREEIVSKVKAYADRLVAAGDMDAFEQVFNSRDVDFDVSTLDRTTLRTIYVDYVHDDEDEEEAGENTTTETPASQIRDKPLTVPEAAAIADADGWITGIVAVDLSVFIANDLEDVLDILGNLLVDDGEILENISYTVIGHRDNSLHIRISGDASTIIADYEDDKPDDHSR